MEPVLLAIRLLGRGYGPCPDGRLLEMGYYGVAASGPIWQPLEEHLGQRAFSPEELRQAADAGVFVPIFHVDNIGPTRAWPRILYHELARYTIEILQVAADIYDVCVRSGRVSRPSGGLEVAPARQLEGAEIPNPAAIAFAAREILARAGGYPEAVRKILEELENTEAFDHTAEPWAKRTIYRRPGRRTRITGASIDLSGPRDAAGNVIVDFQDVFMALAPLVDFLRSPAPSLILNRSGQLHMHRDDPNKMTGVYGPLEIEVQEKMELTLLTKDDTTDVLPFIQKIENALLEHRIILEPDAVRRTYGTTLYVESKIPISFPTIYAAMILNPRTHLRRFSINEIDKIMFKRKNDVLYYHTRTPQGGEINTHVYITPLNHKPRDTWPTFQYGSTDLLKLYSIRIEHTHESHVAQFETDLVQLLHSVDRQQRDVMAIVSLVKPRERTIPPVVPPDMGVYTRNYIYKAGASHRTASDSNRPIYVPTSINGDWQLSINIARLFSASFHNSPNEIYVSVGGKLVKLEEVSRLGAAGISPDSYTALYISAVVGSPAVVNKFNDGQSMVPWVPKNSQQGNNYIQATLRGLPPDRIWATGPIYKRGADRTFFGALSSVFPNIRDTNLQRLAAAAPGGPTAVAALCAPELFDHTPQEVIDSFDAPDSRLHYRIAEHLIGCTILIAVLVDDPYARVAEISAVELELPRHAGAQIRDFSAREETVLLLKYRDISPSGVRGGEEGWCYAVVFQARPLALPATGAGLIQTSVANNPQPIVDPEARDEILARHYAPKMAMFNFADQQHAPAMIEIGHKTLLTLPGIVLIRQSISPDGYTTSITVRGPPESIVAGLLAIGSRSRPAVPVTTTPPIEVTIGLITPIIPLCIAIDQAHTPAPEIVLRLIRGTSGPLPTGVEVRPTPMSSRPGPSPAGRESDPDILVIAGQFFLTPAVPGAPLGSLGILELQRPMTIVLSLLSYSLLQIAWRCVEGNQSPYILPSEIDRAMNEITAYAERRGSSQPHIAIPHRFPPDIAAQKTFAEASIYCLQRYMPGTCIRFDRATLIAIRNYLQEEGAWIAAYAPPREAIRYIAGIHDVVPEENVYPSARNRATYLPARYGRDSITRTWKQYEYAATRYAARHTLASWISFIDLTGAPNAVDLENKTAFVLRINGAVVYGFLTDKDSGRAALIKAARKMGLGNDFQPTMIAGYTELKNHPMNRDMLALFGTSSAIEQGSLYRIHVFAPR
jgi:hypothetical protein